MKGKSPVFEDTSFTLCFYGHQSCYIKNYCYTKAWALTKGVII
ncbi:hypothetical protein SOHN41_00765 [Shewanella sp. HN-41]|nr:hypothetical protein SOHN41_00765 [Shewanella sp. HN-41]